MTKRNSQSISSIEFLMKNTFLTNRTMFKMKTSLSTAQSVQFFYLCYSYMHIYSDGTWRGIAYSVVQEYTHAARLLDMNWYGWLFVDRVCIFISQTSNIHWYGWIGSASSTVHAIEVFSSFILCCCCCCRRCHTDERQCNTHACIATIQLWWASCITRSCATKTNVHIRSSLLVVSINI